MNRILLQVLLQNPGGLWSGDEQSGPFTWASFGLHRCFSGPGPSRNTAINDAIFITAIYTSTFGRKARNLTGTGEF